MEKEYKCKALLNGELDSARNFAALCEISSGENSQIQTQSWVRSWITFTKMLSELLVITDTAETHNEQAPQGLKQKVPPVPVCWCYILASVVVVDEKKRT